MPGNEDIQSIRRALDVLELLGNSPTGLAPWEIVEGACLGKVTVHRILRTMLHKGFIEKAGSPARYSLSAPMNALRTQQATWNRRFLMPAIEQVICLAKKARCSIWVAHYVGGAVIARFRSGPQNAEKAQVLYGWRVMPYGSALIYQAYMDEETLADYRLRNSASASDLDYWKSLRNVDRALEMAKKDTCLAYAKNGLIRAGAAVLDAEGRICGMLGMVRELWAETYPSPTECIELLGEAAKALAAHAAAD